MAATTPKRRAWSLRRLSDVTFAVLGSLAIVSVLALVWTSTMLQENTAAAIRGSRGRGVASELQLSMLNYQRLSNLYLLTRDPHIDAARRDTVRDLKRLSLAAWDDVGGAEEAQLVERTTQRIDQYLRQRAEAEARQDDLGDVVREMEPLARETLADLATLRGVNDVDVKEAHARAQRVGALANLVGAGAGTLIVLGLVGSMLGLRRFVLRPLFGLHETVVRFRAGDSAVQATEGGSREVMELARAFNELTDALRQQRSRELAFLAGVAHDLRNPLAGLKMVTFTLRGKSPPQQREHAIRLLDRQLDHLSRMVGDLLDATRIEAGQLEMSCGRVDLRDVVQHVVDLHGSAAPDHEFVVDIPDDPVLVWGDALRLEQVVGNLVSNAMKFAPHSPCEIEVERDTEAAFVSVADHGPGMSAAEIEGLFVPFRRLRTDAAGAGLGLSVARRIVFAHGGTIEVSSDHESGTRFRVRLPARNRAQGEERSDTHPGDR